MLLLVTFEMLGLFVNTLTSILVTIGKISSNKSKCNYLKNLKNFRQFSIAFLKSKLKSEYFEKKDESHSLSISEIIDFEADGYLNV